MKKVFLMLAATMIGSPALAKPVYLTCTFPGENGKSRDFSVTFDEETQSLSYTSPTGYTTKLPNVVFKANAVVAQNTDISSGLYTTDHWEINRATGAVSRTVKMGSVRFPDKIPEQTLTADNGACATAKTLPRKF
ncbi:hypothetical protein [Sphingomonas ginsengisoli (ex An et al. 2013)]|nr:hypothetical protein [Sphingomonas ginsengisoli An et al. 2013]